MMSTIDKSLTVNGRRYAWPKAPIVVVCIDGCEPDYMDEAIAAGAMPWLAKALPRGTKRLGRLRGAELHQPQQSLDRHRRAAGGARHLRQFLL